MQWLRLALSTGLSRSRDCVWASKCPPCHLCRTTKIHGHVHKRRIRSQMNPINILGLYFFKVSSYEQVLVMSFSILYMFVFRYRRATHPFHIVSRGIQIVITRAVFSVCGWRRRRRDMEDGGECADNELSFTFIPRCQKSAGYRHVSTKPKKEDSLRYMYDLRFSWRWLWRMPSSGV
jgi:hypothetical protein